MAKVLIRDHLAREHLQGSLQGISASGFDVSEVLQTHQRGKDVLHSPYEARKRNEPYRVGQDLEVLQGSSSAPDQRRHQEDEAQGENKVYQDIPVRHRHVFK